MDSSQVDETMWTEYRARLHRFIRARIADADAAEDVVQDVLLRAWQARDALRARDRFVPWLFRIARNAVIDHYRSHRRTTDLPAGLRSETPGPEDVLELSQCLRPFLAELPTHFRDAVMLSDLEGHTQAETARRLGLTLSGAKSRVQRGRRLLAERMEQCCQPRMGAGGGPADFEPPAGCELGTVAAGTECGSCRAL